MEKDFRPNIRPLRGTLYVVLAAPLAFFGLFIVLHEGLGNMLPVVLWCAVCVGLLGWRAWANLTGSEDMRRVGKPAAGALLTLVAGGRLLMALVQMRIPLLEQQGWILWLVAALACIGAIAVFRWLKTTPPARATDPSERWRS
jgi:hypothetical protein